MSESGFSPKFNPIHEFTPFCPVVGDHRPAHCIIEWVEEAARNYPHNIAVIEDRTGRTFTYSVLLQKVEQVANILSKTIQYPDVNVGEKTPLVAILTERSMASVVGILAILKANAAYVPVDPSFPDDRQAHIFSHSQCQLALIDDANRNRLENVRSSVPRVFVLSNDTGLIEKDQYEGTIGDEGDRKQPMKTTAESLAYVLYTSGSTGKPKGVMVKNKGLLNVVDYFVHTLGMHAYDKVLGLTTFCFDISMLELFMPLITGATLYVVTSATQKNPMKIMDVLRKEGITVMQATPTTYEMLLAVGWPGDPQRAMRFLVGGEACRPKIVALAKQCGPFYNVYGPTETSIWSSSYRLPGPGEGPEADELVARGVPVGGPISATTFYLVDEQNRLVASSTYGGGSVTKEVPGVQQGGEVEGELWIGGEGVALGYLHAPDLTVQRFLINPFGTGMIYRTGDLFKRRLQIQQSATALAVAADEEEFIFVRRLDDQVKVNGYRIELGEVEAAIGKHPALQQVVVIVHQDALVAFVQLNHDDAAHYNLLQIRNLVTNQASQSLPPYMIPRKDKILVVQDMPQTPNGKLDKLSLVKLLPELQQQAEAMVIALEEAEEVAAAAQLLQLKQQGTGNGKSASVRAASPINNTSSTSLLPPPPPIIPQKQQQDTLEYFVLQSVQKMSGRTPRATASFAAVGIDSLAAMMYRNTLSQSLGGVSIDPNMLFDPDTTIRSFSSIIYKKLEKEKPDLLMKLGITRATPNDDDDEEHAHHLRHDLEGQTNGIEGGNSVEDEGMKNIHSLGYVLLQKRKVIEGLRGVLTVLVIVDHMYGSYLGGQRIHCDTILFLILTGFTMALQDITVYEEVSDKVNKGISITNEVIWDPVGFLYSRFVGLFPLYWLMMIINIPLLYLFYPNNANDDYTISNADYICIVVLYIFALQTWIVTWCNVVMRGFYFVSLIWGVLLVYTAGKSILHYCTSYLNKLIGILGLIGFVIGMYVYNWDGGFHPPIGCGYFMLGYVFAGIFAFIYRHHSVGHCTQLLQVTSNAIMSPQPLDEEQLAERARLTSNINEQHDLDSNLHDTPHQTQPSFQAYTTPTSFWPLLRLQITPLTPPATATNTNTNTTHKHYSNNNTWQERLARILPSVCIDVFAFFFFFCIFYTDYGVPLSSPVYKSYDKNMLLIGIPILFTIVILTCFLQPRKDQYSLFIWILTETKLLVLLGECSLAIYILQLMFMQYFRMIVTAIVYNVNTFDVNYVKTADFGNDTTKHPGITFVGIVLFVALGVFLQKVYQEQFIAYWHIRLMEWWSSRNNNNNKQAQQTPAQVQAQIQSSMIRSASKSSMSH